MLLISVGLFLLHYQVSKKVVHEIKFGDSCYENLNYLWCSDRYFNTDWQFEMFKISKTMNMVLGLNVNLKLVSLFSVTYIVYLQ